MVKKVSKKIKKRNRIITWVLFGVTVYVLLVNNSLDFLKNFGYEPNSTTIGLILIFVTLVYTLWKAGAGEI